MLDPELIRSFLAVARFGSFSKAAESLYVSHSTISRAVTCLEDQLQTKLLNRSSRSVSLTAAGRLLLERGGDALAVLEQLEQDVRAAGKEAQACLNIASIAMYSSPLFEVYRTLSQTHPEITLSVEQMSIEEVNNSVISGEADAGITLSFTLAPEGGYVVRTISTGNFCAVVPSDHPLNSRQSVHVSELHDVPQLALDPNTASGSFDVVQRITDATGNQTRTRAKSLESLAMQVKAGIGIVTLPEHVAHQFGEGCSVLELQGIDTNYSLVLFHRRDCENPALAEFIRIFDKAFPNSVIKR